MRLSWNVQPPVAMVEVMLAPIAIHTAACLAAPSPPPANRRHGNTSCITNTIAWRRSPPPLRPLPPWQVSPTDSSTKHFSAVIVVEIVMDTRDQGVRHWQCGLAAKGAHSWPRPPRCPCNNFTPHDKSVCLSSQSNNMTYSISTN